LNGEEGEGCAVGRVAAEGDVGHLFKAAEEDREKLPLIALEAGHGNR
jgi:hypothetical protein